VIGDGVSIGENTELKSHVSVMGQTKIGKNNQIYPFSVIGGPPQDISYKNESTRLIIGDNNIIRENCTLSTGTVKGRSVTEVGNENLIMAYSHVAHDCKLGDKILMANGAQLAGHVFIDNNATLGGFSLIHQFVRLGKYSFTSMGSAINKDLPPYCLASGNYARAIGLNRVGLRRIGMRREVIDALAKVFRLLVQRRNSPEEELDILRSRFSEVNEFVIFVKESQRGILRTHLKART
jgi:UDP-N-acetylglucosamine acyltransferase